MRRYRIRPIIIPTICLIVSMYLFALDVQAASKAERAVAAYMRILQRDEYQYELEGNMIMSPTQFAITDLDANGTPELIISPEGTIVSSDNMFYTYNGLWLVRLESKEMDVPSWGYFLTSSDRHSFCYYRGGPAYYDEETGTGVMPYEYIEYKVDGRRIRDTGVYSADEYDDGRIICNSDNHEISWEEYKHVTDSFRDEVVFYDNTEENRAVAEQAFNIRHLNGTREVTLQTYSELFAVILQCIGAICALIVYKGTRGKEIERGRIICTMGVCVTGITIAGLAIRHITFDMDTASFAHTDDSYQTGNDITNQTTEYAETVREEMNDDIQDDAWENSKQEVLEDVSQTESLSDYAILHEELLREFGIDSGTAEDYGENLNPDEYLYYDSGVDEFFFYYPPRLFNDVDKDEDTIETDYGIRVQTIRFFGSRGSELSYSIYRRQNKLQIREETERLADYEYNRFYELTEVINRSNDESGRLVFTGIVDYARARRVYDLLKIDNKYIYHMQSIKPMYRDEEERLLYAYVTENVYRMCGFSGSTKEPRSYEEFLESDP